MINNIILEIQNSLNKNTIDWQYLLKLYRGIDITNKTEDITLNNLVKKLVLSIINIKPTIDLRLLGSENLFFNLNEINEICKQKVKTSILHVDLEAVSDISRYKPGVINLQKFSNIIDEILVKSKLPKIDIFNSKVFTFGSCFAIHFARILSSLGYNVYSNVLSEEINSPINNFYILENIFFEKKHQIIDELNLKEDLKLQIKNSISSASDIIFTLGTTLYLKDKITLQTTINSKNSNNSSFLSYSDSIFYLQEIIKLIRNHNQDANIIISVSPVPIKGVKGNNECPYKSDTLSKSILRSCIHEILNFDSNIFYLPTYEIFRTLPAHCDFSMFGTDDGNDRHIRGDILEKVINKILFYM
jgi:hypothetical protein